MNQSRLRSIDLARGLAVLFMVMVHVLQECGAPTVQSSPFGMVVEFLGGPPSAPVFMVLMGVSQAFSRRATLSGGLRRGVQLLLLGYLLNFLRGTLPVWLGLQMGTMTLDDLAPLTPASLFWEVDILQCAGLMLIVLALVRCVLPRPASWLILAAAVAVGSPRLWGHMSGWPTGDWILNLLWGTGELVYFPLFPWLSYPLTGMAFGWWLAASSNRDAVFRGAAAGGLALLLLCTAVMLVDPAFYFSDYYRSFPVEVGWITGFVLLWVATCQWLVDRIPANPVFNLFYFWSTNVLVFYCIHWVLIGWGAIVFDNRGLLAVILALAGVAALTDQATRFWVRWTRPRVAQGKTEGKTEALLEVPG